MSALFNNYRMFRRMNWFMTFAIGALLITGVFFVYSSGWVSDDMPVRSKYLKQIAWVIIGIISYFLFSMSDYGTLGKLSWWLYGGSIFLLLLVPVIGEEIYGAKRWLMLFGIRFQPSELAKLSTIIALSWALSRPDVDFYSLRPLLISAMIVAVPVLLVVSQPDLGTAIIFFPMVFVMMFVAGVSLRQLGYIVLAAVLALMIILSIVVLPAKMGASEEKRENIAKVVGLRAHQLDRIMVFLNLKDDPYGSGWTKRQSKIAVGSGGVWGKGFKNGTQNILGFLPPTVAPTDFIFSVIAEEKGFSGSVAVLVLFGLIITCGIHAALITQDKLGRLLCIGVVTMIFCHAFVNIAMTIGLMPITGLPLPLLSYGGTFMVVMMSSLGIVQAVHIRARRMNAFEHVR